MSPHDVACSSCGASVAASSAFCTQCGAPFTPHEPTVDLPRTAPSYAPTDAQPLAAAGPEPTKSRSSPERTNGLAVAALVTGIFGFSVLALVFGYVSKGQIDRSGGREKGRGMAITGIVLGWTGAVVGLALFLALVVFASSFDGSSTSSASNNNGFSSGISPSNVPSDTDTGFGTVVTTTTTLAARPSVGIYHVEAPTALRRAPSTSAAQIGSVPAGIDVGIQCAAVGSYVDDPAYDFTPTSDWDRITYLGVTGYIADYYVTTNKDINIGKIPRC